METKLLNKHNLLLYLKVVAIFLISIMVINPAGEFAVNDDWNKKRNIESMRMGDPRINAAADASFILQGLIGTVWSYTFGDSFTSLRALTIIFTAILLFGVYQITCELKFSKKLTFLTLLLTAFNPIIYTSAFTFMTENYFLAFYVWTLYFLLKYLRSGRWAFLLYAGILMGLSILIRQIGLFFFAAFLLYLTLNYLLTHKKPTPSKLLIEVLLVAIPVLVCTVIWLLWPAYTAPDKTILSGVILLDMIPARLARLWMILPYFAFFTLPLQFLSFFGLKKELRYLSILFAGLLISTVYKYDIFPAGNVYYVENLYTKSDFYLSLSIFDNVPFKLLLAGAVSFALSIMLITFFVQIVKNRDKVHVFLISTLIAMLSVALLTLDFFDRYFVPAGIALILLFALHVNDRLKSLKINPLMVFSIFLFIVPTFVLNQEYITQTKLRWQQAHALSDSQNLMKSIYVDGVYARYINAFAEKDYTGLIPALSGGKNLCFTAQYNLDGDSTLFKYANLIDTTLQMVIDKPRIYASRKQQTIPRIKKHLNELIYNQEYTSLLYGLVGKKTYVGSFCVYEEEKN